MQKNKANSGYKWLILATLGLLFFVGNFAQFQMSPIASQIIEQLDLTTTQYSSAFSAPMAPAIFLSIVSGVLVDKMGVKIPVTLSAVLSVIGLAMRLFAVSYVMLYVALFLIGFSTMMVTVNAAKILSQWFSKEKASVMLGIVFALAAAGQTVGLAIGAVFPTIQSGYVFALVLGAVGMVLSALFIRENKGTEDERRTEENGPGILEGIKVSMKNRYVWIIGFCMLLDIGASVVVTSMLPTVLAARGVASVSAGIISSAFTVGGLVGCILMPNLVARNGGKRRLILIVAGVIAVFGVWLGWRTPAGVVMFIVMFLAGLCINSMGPVLTSIPIQLPDIGPAYAGTAGGVITTLQLMGPVLVVPYIITPLSGGNNNIYFALGAVCMAAFVVLCLFLPASVAKTLRGRKK